SAIHRAIKRWYMRQQPAQQGPALPDGAMMLVRPGGDTEVVDTRTLPATVRPPNVAVRPEEAVPPASKPAAAAPAPANGARKQRAELLDEIARRSSVDEDLGFLFGIEQPSDTERIDQLERRFLSLLRLLHGKGLLTPPEVKKLMGR